MATHNVSAHVAELRLDCLEALCSQLASGIYTAKSVLRSNAEDADTAHLVADALDRLGWLADRAAGVASSRSKPPVAGAIENWVLGEHVAGLLKQLEPHQI